MDGSSLAEVFGCHFMTTGPDFRSRTNIYDAFLHDALERKEATEMQRMYISGASSTDGEGCGGHSSTPERGLLDPRGKMKGEMRNDLR